MLIFKTIILRIISLNLYCANFLFSLYFGSFFFIASLLRQCFSSAPMLHCFNASVLLLCFSVASALLQYFYCYTVINHLQVYSCANEQWRIKRYGKCCVYPSTRWQDIVIISMDFYLFLNECREFSSLFLLCSYDTWVFTRKKFNPKETASHTNYCTWPLL